MIQEPIFGASIGTAKFRTSRAFSAHGLAGGSQSQELAHSFPANAQFPRDEAITAHGNGVIMVLLGFFAQRGISRCSDGVHHTTLRLVG